MEIMDKKRLFIFDLDDTVLIPGQEPYARLSDFFSEFLDAISERGWSWGINSTWDVNGQWHLVLVSGIKSRPAFLIGELGLRIAAVKNSRLEFLQPYKDNMEKRVQGIIEKELYPVMSRICSRFNPSRMHFYGHLFDFVVDEREKKEFDGFTAGINAENLIIGRRNGRFSAYPAMLNKGEPVKEIIRITGLSPEEIVVAGDAVADIPMMETPVSKNPLCPFNAADEVKKHVKAAGGIISEAPYARGVVEAFRRLVKNKTILQ